MLSRLLEHISDATCTDTDKHLDKVGAADREERHSCLTGYRLGKQSFTSSGITDKQTSFWNVSTEDYIDKLSPIINLDITKKYVLCFGDDACCKANLAFMIENLKAKGYPHPIQVQILNEYNLELQKEYFI